MTGLSIGGHALAECSTITTAQRLEGFGRDSGHHGVSAHPLYPEICFVTLTRGRISDLGGAPAVQSDLVTLLRGSCLMLPEKV